VILSHFLAHCFYLPNLNSQILSPKFPAEIHKTLPATHSGRARDLRLQHSRSRHKQPQQPVNPGCLTPAASVCSSRSPSPASSFQIPLLLIPFRRRNTAARQQQPRDKTSQLPQQQPVNLTGLITRPRPNITYNSRSQFC
jgi:hypothetical protein